MSKRQIRKEAFWRLALRFGIVFLIVIVVIQLIWKLIASGNLQAITESLQNGQWVIYVASKLILGLVYGVTMAFFTKRNAKK